jgi:hypothetical protein
VVWQCPVRIGRIGFCTRVHSRACGTGFGTFREEAAEHFLASGMAYFNYLISSHRKK